VVTSILLFSGAALALPSRLNERVARRARSTNPLIHIEEGFARIGHGHSEVSHNVTFSSNWAGAVLVSPPTGESFNSAVGTFTIPNPSNPGGQSDASASAWVGIDGDTATAAILQAGVDFTVSTSGAVTYDAWYEWFPNPATDFTGFPMSAGDSVTVTIQSTSPTNGSVTLENNTQQKSVTKALTAPTSTATLAGQNAEWIVEDFSVNGGLVNFVDFGQVPFTDCSASTSSQSVGLNDANIIEIKGSNGSVLTNVSIDGPSAVSIAHV